jgi:hypothetical protein
VIVLGFVAYEVSKIVAHTLVIPPRQRPHDRPGNPSTVEKRGRRIPDLREAAKRGTTAANVRPIIEEIMRAGATSHNAIAAKLNERNVRTAPKAQHIARRHPSVPSKRRRKHQPCAGLVIKHDCFSSHRRTSGSVATPPSAPAQSFRGKTVS